MVYKERMQLLLLVDLALDVVFGSARLGELVSGSCLFFLEYTSGLGMLDECFREVGV